VPSIHDIQPFIRTAHYYIFPMDLSDSERNRLGYCYAFHLIAEGKGAVVIGDTSYSVRKGSLLFIPPEIPHSFLKAPGDVLASYNIYCELWNKKPLHTRVHLAGRQEPYNPAYVTPAVPCRELASWPYYTPTEHQPFLNELFTRCVAAYNRNDETSRTAANRLFGGWVLEMAEALRSASPYDLRIQKVVQRMEAELSATASLDRWSEQAGLHKSQFHQLFKQMTGVTPSAYLLRLKMNTASAQLLESSRSVTSIAESLGYTSIHYFTKQFTSYFGISPTAYRRLR
jgi:AraC family transcriptional activator of mtrCDE